MTQERGSDLLKRSYGNPTTIDEKALQRVAEISDSDGVKVLRWWIKGQPRPELISGTLEVEPGQVGRVVAGLLEFNEAKWTFETFPIGVIAIDKVILNLQHGQ